MATVHFVPSLTEAFGEESFHPHRFLIRHRIQVSVELRHKPHPVFFDDTSGFDAGLVILEPFFGRQARHPHVIRGPAIAFRVPQVDDVNGMVVGHGGVID